MRTLVAIPVYNEQKYVCSVLANVLEYADDVLVIDDGSSDQTPSLLAKFPVEVIRHARNRGYGKALQDALTWATVNDYDWIITMDCDEQHEPQAIPEFLNAARENTHDVISGSRYFNDPPASAAPPADRRFINEQITQELNDRLGLRITDAFCGFKAYRTEAVRDLLISEDGYAMPMQFWVRAVAHGLRVLEIPVSLIYNDMNRSFGGPLDNPRVRYDHYRQVLHCELERCAKLLPERALDGINAGCRCPEQTA